MSPEVSSGCYVTEMNGGANVRGFVCVLFVLDRAGSPVSALMGDNGRSRELSVDSFDVCVGRVELI